MKLILVITLYFINLRSYGTQNTDAFYWKDFHVTYPTDAIPAGVDNYGSPTYIGQFPISKLPVGETADVVPATIFQNTYRAYAAYKSKVVASSENVKILCVSNQYQNPVMWSNTFVSRCNLIEGGRTTNNNSQTFYVGRTNYKGQNVTGSFSKDDFILNVPWTAEIELSVLQFLSFDMLFSCTN